MELARHLEILRHEGELLAAMPVEALDAPVPTIEDWTLERVLRHTGKVHQWVTGLLRLPAGVETDQVGELPGIGRGAQALTDYRSALDALLEAFASREANEEVPSFIGPADVAWWGRRQAQEVSVHRVDAADAVHAATGAPVAALQADGAADGVDEWARVFLATRWGQRFGDFPEDLAGRTLHLHGTDAQPVGENTEWLLAFTPEGLAVTTGHAKGDVVLRAPVADLLLTLWRRRPLDGVEVLGDRALAERVLELATF